MGTLFNSNFNLFNVTTRPGRGQRPQPSTQYQVSEKNGMQAREIAYTSPILITEFNTDPDYIEIQNVTPAAFDATGWQLILSESTDLNESNTVTQTLGILQPYEINYWDDQIASPDYWGSNINWTANRVGWAMLVDTVGAVQDFVTWNTAFANIQAMEVSGGGFPTIPIGAQWLTDGVPIGAGFASGAARINAWDTNKKSDWESIPPQPASPDTTNQNLSLPFRNKTTRIKATPQQLRDWGIQNFRYGYQPGQTNT